MKKLIGILAALALLGLCACALAESRTAVVYFSCTGTTQGIAEWIAEETGGELMQILPAVPYTEEDLAYYTDCRADLEQADDSARPEIANLPESMAQYDTVFLGWPIWHGKAPKIIYTFLEGVDLTGSTIIPFCTSASSPMGSSAELLQPLTAAWWRDGRRFGQSAEKEDVAEWVAGLGLNRKISITVGGETRLATLANSPSAEAFYALLPLTVSMEDYGGFEKVGPLGTKIVQCDERITTAPGDIILYQGDKVTIYYAENTWSFTRLGHLDNDADVHAFLGDGDPTVTFDAAPDATPEEPEPTTATVGTLKYSLKGGNATVTGPKSQNAKKLTIPATIVAGMVSFFAFWLFGPVTVALPPFRLYFSVPTVAVVGSGSSGVASGAASKVTVGSPSPRKAWTSASLSRCPSRVKLQVFSA